MSDDHPGAAAEPAAARVAAVGMEQLRKLALEATPGPWRWEMNADIGGAGDLVSDVAPVAFAVLQHVDPDAPGLNDDFAQLHAFSFDAAYIAAANPATVLALIDRLERAEALLAKASPILFRLGLPALDGEARDLIDEIGEHLP